MKKKKNCIKSLNRLRVFGELNDSKKKSILSIKMFANIFRRITIESIEEFKIIKLLSY